MCVEKRQQETYLRQEQLSHKQERNSPRTKGVRRTEEVDEHSCDPAWTPVQVQLSAETEAADTSGNGCVDE